MFGKRQGGGQEDGCSRQRAADVCPKGPPLPFPYRICAAPPGNVLPRHDFCRSQPPKREPRHNILPLRSIEHCSGNSRTLRFARAASGQAVCLRRRSRSSPSTCMKMRGCFDSNPASWHLEIRKRPWGMTLTNNQTGLAWRLEDTNGIEWAQASNEKPRRFVSQRYATFSVTKICGGCRLLSPVRTRLQLSRSRFSPPRSFDSRSARPSTIPVRTF